jgi:hypothetical protein
MAGANAALRTQFVLAMRPGDKECGGIISTELIYPLSQKSGAAALALRTLRAVGDAKPQDAPPRLDQLVFLRASYVVGQDRNEVWWPTYLISGYKRGPECQINSTCT